MSQLLKFTEALVSTIYNREMQEVIGLPSAQNYCQIGEIKQWHLGYNPVYKNESLCSLWHSTLGLTGRSVLDLRNANFQNKILGQRNLPSAQLIPRLISIGTNCIR